MSGRITAPVSVCLDAQVKEKEAQEAKARAEELRKIAEAMAQGKGIPLLDDLMKDEEEPPDATVEVPANKVKLVIG